METITVHNGYQSNTQIVHPASPGMSPNHVTGNPQARLVMHTRTHLSGWSRTCPAKHKALQSPEEAGV